jgi:hypothetical protein
MWTDGRYNIMGWSRDGKIAYAYYAPAQARPPNYTGFTTRKSSAAVVVYDLVKDHQVAFVDKDYIGIFDEDLKNF